MQGHSPTCDCYECGQRPKSGRSSIGGLSIEVNDGPPVLQPDIPTDDPNVPPIERDALDRELAAIGSDVGTPRLGAKDYLPEQSGVHLDRVFDTESDYVAPGSLARDMRYRFVIEAEQFAAELRRLYVQEYGPRA